MTETIDRANNLDKRSMAMTLWRAPFDVTLAWEWLG